MSATARILIEGSSIDWMPWCSEKSGKVAYFLGATVESLWEAGIYRKRNDGPPDLWDNLHIATDNALRIWTWSLGLLNDHRTEHIEMILRNGTAGCKALESLYGERDNLDPRGIYDVLAFAEEAEGYLVPAPRHDERTLLHDVIHRCRVRHPLVRRLGKMLEAVSLGEQPWSSFVPEAHQVLQTLRASSS
jgi:hypothetical protein